MYAQIIDEKTKQVNVGEGTDTEFYKSIGMEEMEVEQGYDGSWYVKGYAPAQPLDELKFAKLAELKSMRDTLEVEPITYNGNNFDYDEKARDRINAAIIALDVRTQLTGTEATISWTTADDSDATVTANDLRGVIANVALRSNELHIRYRELKEQVEQCTTKEELESIMWGD